MNNNYTRTFHINSIEIGKFIKLIEAFGNGIDANMHYNFIAKIFIVELSFFSGIDFVRFHSIAVLFLNTVRLVGIVNE